MFLAINGAGLGHLTRCLAIADRLRMRAPESEIVFLTTSIAVPQVHQLGYQCHHIPSYELVAPAVGPAAWNMHFFRMTEEVMQLHRPEVLVFDGGEPYLGLRRVINLYRRRLRFVWVRRGAFKRDFKVAKLRAAESLFDRVIVPSEWGEALDANAIGPSDRVSRVAPVLLLDRDAALTRGEALESLALDVGRPVCYVQLGAGNINQIGTLESAVVGWLRDAGFRVVVGRSPIALRRLWPSSAERVITDFPNARYFNAFDLAVLAGGYNSVNEAIAFGLPAIFIPNAATAADDQARRCFRACAFGAFEVLEDVSREAFLAAVGRLCPAAFEGRIDQTVSCVNGAIQAAEIIHSLMRTPAGR
ncbi:glycosyltransferase [Thiocapsa marina]|uniref:UDP-N-acetylglucosamine:LPS N-acetylglucosamine transferase n=1 Tax=Thiocapsa marina 5811 TaxID=768671 RepID=F9UIK9_9GAMM|nr:UDP-N-acetylglucosamine--LPS N-acetylglucosamine transferase [Thiocapsa marina]EGV15963.1 UDP-N-acetylglucosamine:LPS N-acetylglucosamine transferase [Thiocapsa marina 5811]